VNIVFHVCVQMFFLLYSSAKIVKIKQVFPELWILWSQTYCHIFYESECIWKNWNSYKTFRKHSPYISWIDLLSELWSHNIWLYI